MNGEKTYKVLIVEDELKLQKAMGDRLRREGWQVVVAGNGEEGLRMVEKDNPDLVLLDIMMPVMDGMTMLKRLRKISKVPVIIMTNLYDESKLTKAFKLGSFDYLAKANCSLDEIVKKAKAALGIEE